MRIRVLLVEDHSDTRNVLELLLKRCGCQTVTAKNAKDARARLGDMDFDGADAKPLRPKMRKMRERVSATWISMFSSVISTCLTAMESISFAKPKGVTI